MRGRTTMIDSFVSDLLKTVPDRTRDVLSRRLGLETGTQETLDKIGKDFKITRERVRQIEAAGVAQISKHLPKTLDQFYKTATEHLRHFDGVREESRLLHELAYVLHESESAEQKIRFLLLLNPSFAYEPSNDVHAALWAQDKQSAAKVIAFVKAFDKALEKRSAPVAADTIESFVMDIAKKSGYKNAKPGTLMSYVTLSKKVLFSPFGYLGVSTMKEIAPANVGDKALLVLRNAEHPLHFRELAQHINQHAAAASEYHPVWSRTVRAQTVHNELIRNPGFVLVGRGIYALKEWGYAGGTVRQILADILKKAGKSMPLDEIVKRVQKQKLVKESTIFINLQNKKFFAKDAQGKYGLRRIARSVEEI